MSLSNTSEQNSCGNLSAASPFQLIATNLAGVAGIKAYSDSTATNGGPYFYRVGVQ